jgi:tRNA-Thr(GGU) m(6)t(6)A37 methyltransferase TsaA
MGSKTAEQELGRVVPVGYVHAGDEGFFLEILEPYRPALRQLDRFSHVHVFWWFDQNDHEKARRNLQDRPPYAPSETVGVFASRSDQRPNPIALTTCMVLSLDEKTGIVVIPWVDALDGTPILDLKPYIPVSDRVRDVRVAPWFEKWPACLEDAASFDFGSVGL